MMTMIGTLQSVPLHPWKHTQSIPTMLPCPEQAASIGTLQVQHSQYAVARPYWSWRNPTSPAGHLEPLEPPIE